MAANIGKTYILGVLGTHFSDDEWILSDFCLFYYLFKSLNVDRQIWLTSVDLHEFVSKNGPLLHGHLKGERKIVFDESSESFYSVFPSTLLASNLDSYLTSFTCEACEEVDRIVVVICCHGEGVLMHIGGEPMDGPEIWYSRERFYANLENVKARVTIISTACYSGMMAEGVNDKSLILSLTPDLESLALPMSGSRSDRGGWFAKVLTDELRKFYLEGNPNVAILADMETAILGVLGSKYETKPLSDFPIFPTMPPSPWEDVAEEEYATGGKSTKRQRLIELIQKWMTSKPGL